MKKNKKKIIIEIILTIVGTFLILFGVACFNKYLLLQIPLILRMIVMILIYWTIAIVPIILMIKNKEKLSTIGFKKENKLKQILIGIGIAIAISVFFTIIPMFIIGKDAINSTYNYKYVWQFAYDLFYKILSIALVEEVIFRGFLLEKFKQIINKPIIPIILTSILFGLFHAFNGDIMQVIITSIIGFILAMCKEKIKNCSLLSLIIAHGLYDWLIVLFTAIL